LHAGVGSIQRAASVLPQSAASVRISQLSLTFSVLGFSKRGGQPRELTHKFYRGAVASLAPQLIDDFLGLSLLRVIINWNVPLRQFGSCAIDKPTGGNLYRPNVARAIAWHVLALARLHYSIRWFRNNFVRSPDDGRWATSKQAGQ